MPGQPAGTSTALVLLAKRHMSTLEIPFAFLTWCQDLNSLRFSLVTLLTSPQDNHLPFWNFSCDNIMLSDINQCFAVFYFSFSAFLQTVPYVHDFLRIDWIIEVKCYLWAPQLRPWLKGHIWMSDRSGKIVLTFLGGATRSLQITPWEPLQYSSG